MVVTAIRVIPSYNRFTASLVVQPEMPQAVGYEGATEEAAIASLRKVYDRLPADLPIVRVDTQGR